MTVTRDDNVPIGFRKNAARKCNHVEDNLSNRPLGSWGYPRCPRVICACLASGNDDSKLSRKDFGMDFFLKSVAATGHADKSRAVKAVR